MTCDAPLWSDQYSSIYLCLRYVPLECTLHFSLAVTFPPGNDIKPTCRAHSPFREPGSWLSLRPREIPRGSLESRDGRKAVSAPSAVAGRSTCAHVTPPLYIDRVHTLEPRI